MTVDRALTWFINGWIGLIVVLNMVSIVGVFLTAPSIWAAISKVQEIYDPYNLWNFAAEVISIAPALAVYSWRERRRKRIVSEVMD